MHSSVSGRAFGSTTADPRSDTLSPDILLIEDDAPLREMLRDSLEDEGYLVMEAPDASVAMRLMTEYQPRLIIVDLVTPDADDYRVLNFARRLQPVPHAVVMSGGPDGDAALYERVSRLIGADHILNKPFPLTNLLAVVRTCFVGHGEQQRGRVTDASTANA